MIKVLYEDEHLLAVDKPSGLHVHASKLTPGEKALVDHLRDERGESAALYPAHRIDRPTSGVVLFARSREAASELSRMFREHKMQKSYLAAVRGWIDEAGTIDHPVTAKKSGKDRRDAQTEFVRLACCEKELAVGAHDMARYSLLEARPLTGRRHQIRCHLKHCFHPIIGDTIYGDGRHNRAVREVLGFKRMFLHARDLSFIHPFTDVPVKIEAPVDSYWERLFDWAGWE
jgi:tRNA pseudouridine65 synthase